MPHFTFDGWVQPVVNPYTFTEQGQHSPEGQAFVLQLHAAWRDWVQNGAIGANGTGPDRVRVPAVSAGVVGSILSAFNAFA